MAKLNGVKTVDTASGEITKVAYDGAEYGAIERGGDAIPGDIIRINANDIIDGTKGAFYGVGENGRYSDNDEALRNPNYPGLRNSYDVFRKIEEANAMTTFKKGDVVVTVDKVGWAVSGQGLVGKGAVGKVKGVNGDRLTVKFGKKQPLHGAATSTRKNFVLRTSEVRLATADEAASIAKKKAEKTIEFEGEQYRKVDRKAQAGDVVVLRDTGGDLFKVGKAYKVVDGVQMADNDGDLFDVYRDEIRRTPKTVDVYEKVEAEYVPQEGDIVVITKKTSSRNSVGDVGKVTGVGAFDFRVEVPSKPNSPSVNGNWHMAKSVRKATPAEVEAYEKAVHKASFSVGDYVKIVKSERGNEGKIVEITKVADGEQHRRLDGARELSDFLGKVMGEPQVYGFLAEQIVKATEQEVADASKPKLKAGDFVKITDGTRSIVDGKVYEVFGCSFGLYIVDNDGDKRVFPLVGGTVKYEIIPADEAKWAKIGRKVNEAKAGDIVRVTWDVNAKPVGTIFKVAKVYAGISSINDENGKSYTLGSNVELIAPVESTLK